MSAEQHSAAIAAADAAGWLPTSVAGLIGWYEVRSDLVTVVSGAASEVNNRVVGGANPLVQALSGSGQRPTYEAAGWNGKASLLFNGTTNFMTAAGLAASVTGTDVPFTIIMAMQIITIGTVVGTNRAFWNFGNTADDNPLCGFTILDGTANGAMSRRDSAGALKQRAQATALTTSRATYAHKFTGTRVAERSNGTLDANLDGVTSPSAEVDVGALTLNTFSVGCAVRTTASWLTNFRLGGMLIYTGALTDADILQAERYLRLMHPL